MKTLKVYECKACGLHYDSIDFASQCEAWCTQNMSCNMEFAQYSVETRKPNK